MAGFERLLAERAGVGFGLVRIVERDSFLDLRFGQAKFRRDLSVSIPHCRPARPPSAPGSCPPQDRHRLPDRAAAVGHLGNAGSSRLSTASPTFSATDDRMNWSSDMPCRAASSSASRFQPRRARSRITTHSFPPGLQMTSHRTSLRHHTLDSMGCQPESPAITAVAFSPTVVAAKRSTATSTSRLLPLPRFGDCPVAASPRSDRLCISPASSPRVCIVA